MAEETLTAQALRKIMPTAITKMADERIEVCNTCDKLSQSNRKCLMCGCYMDLKVFIPDSKCPLKKW